MMDIFFTTPPFPCFMCAGEDTYYFGDRHPARANLGAFDLLIVTKGALYINEDNRDMAASEGHALILKPNKAHYTYHSCDEETSFYWIHFQSLGVWSEQTASGYIYYPHSSYQELEPLSNDERLNMRSSMLRLPQFCKLVQPQKVYEMAEQLLELTSQPQSWVRWKQQTIFQSLILELHASAESEKDAASLRLAEKVAEYVRQNYRNSLSYAQIRETFSFHPTYISRCMKHAYGMNLTEYIIMYRIEQAALLLIKTDLAVSHIAEQVGFANLSYFARRFSKAKGVNPGKYRKQYSF
ncbi:helix-turn-helix transcriptional regulator [Paenibacillus albus]|uniref:AraC family transcriptional regulator n=1 Tax=Paenibacillus albus TaxID=2495582 RepID=A0A3S9A7N1_9BACL|nr:AraC family transcriptional regulator [Paenibacillus albus]AZN41713.1 AraC family transcriptional regulator [Paenibacillus albus]